jgi:hypothetical protein
MLGNIWAGGKPNIGSCIKFPEGTVCFKLLFTDASIDQVPYLKGSVEWQADVNERANPAIDDPLGKLLRKRKVSTVRLVQIDIAVRDARANSTTGWVFGTFVYDNKIESSDPWHRMMPIGLAWGNDPGVTPTNGTLKECWTNVDTPLNGPLGWAGRPNGAVDNRSSSCMSCHSTASNPPSPALPPRNANDQQRLIWFRNIQAGEPFAAGVLSTDYSLQLAKAVDSYFNQNPTSGGPATLQARGSETLPITRDDLDTHEFQESTWKFLRDRFPDATSK